MWANRIIARGETDPRTLKAHPRNWRLHTETQAQALAAILTHIGWVKGVVVNQRTGHLLDGHLRVEQAIQAGVNTVPVTYVELEEDEETLILTTFDALTRMAQADAAALETLLGRIALSAAPLQALLDEMAGKTSAILLDKSAEYVRPNKPLPDTHARIGTYVFTVPRAVFLAWEEELRQSVGFNAGDIAREIVRRLGIETRTD